MVARIIAGFYTTSDGRITRFAEPELACKCGCGWNEMQEPTIDALHETRIFINRPIIVTSGVRCAAHNEAVGGRPDGAHPKGLAVDSYCTLDTYAYYMALKRFFRRVTMYSDQMGHFCHADMWLDGPLIHDVVTCDGKFLLDAFLEYYKITAVRDAINEVLEAT